MPFIKREKLRKGKDMYAVINNNLYWYQHFRGKTIVLARKGQPVDYTFEEKGDVFQKIVNIDDTEISDVYNVKFYVGYKDCLVENNDIWEVGDGFPSSRPYRIENGEACIGTIGAVSGNGWETNGRDESYKIIQLSDCSSFSAEYEYSKKDGVVCSEPVKQKIELSREELITLILTHRV